MNRRDNLKPWLRGKPVWVIKTYLVLGSLVVLTVGAPIIFIIAALENHTFPQAYSDICSELVNWVKWKEE